MRRPLFATTKRVCVLVIVALAAAGTVRAADEPAATTEGAADVLTTERAAALVDDVAGAVEELRGLEFRQPVPVEVIDDDAAREHVIQRLESFQSREQLDAVELAYKLLGLLPPEIDILQAYLDALREQAGGFYDPASKSFYLLDDMPPALGPMLAAHELTHALEDQYYDLDTRLREAIHNDDLIFAHSAVHEGSASLLMTIYSAQQMLAGEMDPIAMQAFAETEAAKAEVLLSLPPLLQRQLVGPYVLGTGFLTGGNVLGAMVQGFPKEKADRIYADGPLSSEQILHPSKYWDEGSRDDPRAVSLGGAGEILGSGWRRSFSGVLGEISLGVLVGAPTPRDFAALAIYDGEAWTNQAASGWDGDRWELWQREGESVVLLGTVWDSPADADQFAAALQTCDDLAWKAAGDRVAVVAGDAGEKQKKLLKRILAASKQTSD
jgi:hypothetical protein